MATASDTEMSRECDGHRAEIDICATVAARTAVFHRLQCREADKCTMVNDMIVTDGVAQCAPPLAALSAPGTVFFSGYFSLVGAELFGTCLRRQCHEWCPRGAQSRITVVIDSRGGDVAALSNMERHISLLRPEFPKVKIVTIAVNTVCSCGFILFMLGDQCHITKGTRLLMHQPYSMSAAGQLQTESTVGEMEADIGAIKQRVYDMCERHVFARLRRGGRFQGQGNDGDRVADLFQQCETADKTLREKYHELFRAQNDDTRKLEVETLEEEIAELTDDGVHEALTQAMRASWFEKCRESLRKMRGARESTAVVTYDAKEYPNIFSIILKQYAQDEDTHFLTPAEMSDFLLVSTDGNKCTSKNSVMLSYTWNDDVELVDR